MFNDATFSLFWALLVGGVNTRMTVVVGDSTTCSGASEPALSMISGI